MTMGILSSMAANKAAAEAVKNRKMSTLADQARFSDMKPTLATNPKDAVGVKKWRQFFCIPTRVMWEVGVGMLEGALKYGRFNYRVTGVQASIYIDAAKGHISAWEEGRDIDPDSGMHEITKAICSLIVLRDGIIEGNFVDDRAPKHLTLDAHTAELQATVDKLFEKYGDDPAKPLTQVDRCTAEYGAELSKVASPATELAEIMQAAGAKGAYNGIQDEI